MRLLTTAAIFVVGVPLLFFSWKIAASTNGSGASQNEMTPSPKVQPPNAKYIASKVCDTKASGQAVSSPIEPNLKELVGQLPSEGAWLKPSPSMNCGSDIVYEWITYEKSAHGGSHSLWRRQVFPDVDPSNSPQSTCLKFGMKPSLVLNPDYQSGPTPAETLSVLANTAITQANSADNSDTTTTSSSSASGPQVNATPSSDNSSNSASDNIASLANINAANGGNSVTSGFNLVDPFILSLLTSPSSASPRITIIEWYGPEAEVYISGSWDGWQAKHAMGDGLRSVGKFFQLPDATIDSQSGRYYFKFIINDVWLTSPDYFTETDPSGNVNNYVVIQ
jgi:hypothetical protein